MKRELCEEMRLNRRGFVAAILAAPLAAVGSFANNHTVTWAEFVAFMKGTKMGPYKTASISPSKGTWVTVICEQESYTTMLMDVHVSTGGGAFKKLERRFTNCQGIREIEFLPGDLCG